MTPSFSAFNTQFVAASGTGVIGLTGKPLYLQGIFNGSASGQGLALFSGSAAVTMAWVTMPARLYTEFPMAAPGGITYQPVGNPGDADLKLVFFYTPGTNT
jgi:hypothetical protein